MVGGVVLGQGSPARAPTPAAALCSGLQFECDFHQWMAPLWPRSWQQSTSPANRAARPWPCIGDCSASTIGQSRHDRGDRRPAVELRLPVTVDRMLIASALASRGRLGCPASVIQDSWITMLGSRRARRAPRSFPRALPWPETGPRGFSSTGPISTTTTTSAVSLAGIIVSLVCARSSSRLRPSPENPPKSPAEARADRELAARLQHPWLHEPAARQTAPLYSHPPGGLA